jgi:hypothetical protein
LPGDSEAPAELGTKAFPNSNEHVRKADVNSSLNSQSLLSCVKDTSANSSSVSMENTHSSARSLSIREASFEDYPKIVALESKYGLETKSYEEWTHLWSNNAAYRQYEKALPIGWVLTDENQNIVGYLGNIPLFYELEGRTLLASVAHAWVTDARYRSYSIMLLERYFSQKVVDLFLNATVGPLASDSFAVFKPLPAPAGAWDRSAFWITNYQGFVEGWLATKAFPLSKPLSYVLSAGLFVKDTFARRQVRKHDTGIEVEPCADVDGRFDIFWDALRKTKSHILMAVRTREMLEWHFKYALRKNKAWIVTVSKGSDLTAYGIFRRHDSPRFGLRRMRLVDFQTLDGNTAILIPMLAWAIKRCRREGIDMLECIGFRTDIENVISKIAPHERKLPSWLYFYKARDKSLAEILIHPNVWNPSQFDGDASL